jgi:hypothetical protein
MMPAVTLDAIATTRRTRGPPHCCSLGSPRSATGSTVTCYPDGRTLWSLGDRSGRMPVDRGETRRPRGVTFLVDVGIAPRHRSCRSGQRRAVQRASTTTPPDEVASYDIKPIVATHSGRTGRRVDRVVAAHPARVTGRRDAPPRSSTRSPTPLNPPLLITVTARTADSAYSQRWIGSSVSLTAGAHRARCPRPR